MEYKREITLKSFFIKNVFMLLLFLIINLLLHLMLLNFLLLNNIILPANYYEKELYKVIGEKQTIYNVNFQTLPDVYEYGKYNKDGVFLEGNIESMRGEKIYRDYNKSFRFKIFGKKTIKVKNKDNIFLITYPLYSTFNDNNLSKIFPNYDYVFIIQLLVSVILIVLIWATIVSKKIRIELNQLLLATEEISNNNLDFSLSLGEIMEVNKLIKGINQVSGDLKNSLVDKWKEDAKIKEQIIAITHDLKTPLTIIKGNAQLLEESKLSLEDYENVRYILKSSQEIESYIGKILDSKIEENGIKEIKIRELVNEIIIESEKIAYFNSKEIMFVDNLNEELLVRGNKDDLKRAITNIVNNGIEYAKKRVVFSINLEKDTVLINIKDDGKGFNYENIQKVKELFYMEDKSRKLKNHHGMGLYIANNIIETIGGKLSIEKVELGASINIHLPRHIN